MAHVPQETASKARANLGDTTRQAGEERASAIPAKGKVGECVHAAEPHNQRQQNRGKAARAAVFQAVEAGTPRQAIRRDPQPVPAVSLGRALMIKIDFT